jgi:hypothetical protein
MRKGEAVIVSIMQPYLFPYIGYFQLMAASDLFVSYDDSQYIKGGWINRNRILLGGRSRWFTLPVIHASHKAEIRSREYVRNPFAREHLAGQLAACYRHAVNRDFAVDLTATLLGLPEFNVASYNQRTLAAIASALGISVPIIASSSISRSATGGPTARVIEICHAVGADVFLNPIGGSHLYNHADFDAKGIELAFLEPSLQPYQQGEHPHVPGLSILDVMMHNRLPVAATMAHHCLVTRKGPT